MWWFLGRRFFAEKISEFFHARADGFSHAFDFDIYFDKIRLCFFVVIRVATLFVLHHFDFHLGSLFWVHVSSFSCDARDDDEGNANAVVVIIIVLLLLLFDVVVVVVVVVAKLVSPFCIIIEREKKPKKKEYYDDEAEKATP